MYNPVSKILYLTKDNLHGFGDNGVSRPRKVTEYEIALFIADGGQSVIDGVTYPIKRGDIRILKPGQWLYSYRFSDLYNMHLVPNFIGGEQIEKLPQFTTCENYEGIVGLFEEMISAYVKNSEESTIKIYSLIYELIYRISRSVKNADTAFGLNVNCVSAIKNAKEYINKNYMRKITLSDIAASVNLHPNYLHRVFKKYADITPREYILQTRISAAKRLLICTNNTIETIAATCGFDSASYFISVFKGLVGTTPSKYREQNVKDVL